MTLFSHDIVRLIQQCPCRFRYDCLCFRFERHGGIIVFKRKDVIDIKCRLSPCLGIFRLVTSHFRQRALVVFRGKIRYVACRGISSQRESQFQKRRFLSDVIVCPVFPQGVVDAVGGRDNQCITHAVDCVHRGLAKSVDSGRTIVGAILMEPVEGVVVVCRDETSFHARRLVNIKQLERLSFG